MTYCHECGSEVAESDVFCPFCGISLEPVNVDNGEDVEFQSTIVMPMPPKGGAGDAVAKSADTAAAKQESSAVKETGSASASKFQEADTKEQIEGIETPDDADKVDTAEHPAVEDVPVPKVLTEFEYVHYSVHV